jgi:glutamine amidotransferase
MIALLDVGLGNLRSVARALTAAAPGKTPPSLVLTRDPDVVRRADRVVMPGQGAFGDCARALAHEGGALASAVRESITAGTPYLGICLGLQVLFAASEEAPDCTGLGVFPGRVQRFPAPLHGPDGSALKVPHVGWNRVQVEGSRRAVLGEDDWYYFVHSFFVVPEDPALVAARTEHGLPFVSAIAHENVLAVQFHPEKSQRAGLALLQRWLENPSGEAAHAR